MHGVYYLLEPSLGRASAAFWAAVVVALIATAGTMIGWVREEKNRKKTILILNLNVLAGSC